MFDIESARPQLIEMLAPAEAVRQEALRLEGRTDADFLGPDNNLDETKKRAGKKQIEVARERFSKQVFVELGRLAEVDYIDDPLDAIVLHTSLDDKLSGWRKIPGYQRTPADSETAVDFAIGEVSRFQSAIEWWKNPSELLAYLALAT